MKNTTLYTRSNLIKFFVEDLSYSPYELEEIETATKDLSDTLSQVGQAMYGPQQPGGQPSGETAQENKEDKKEEKKEEKVEEGEVVE